MKFPFYYQREDMDCGPTCLYLISKFYGRIFNIDKLRELSEIGKEGINMLGLHNAAESIGLKAYGVQLTMEEIKKAHLPAILHWDQHHFIVLYKIKKNRFYVADPAKGRFTLSEGIFKQRWLNSKAENNKAGVALLIEPSSEFYSKNFNDEYQKNTNGKIGTVFNYLKPHKKLVFNLILALACGSLIQLILPFLAQNIVDIGVNTANINFIRLIVIAEAALLAGRLFTDVLRGWILYYISSRINIFILTDFLIKIMKLPISYFDSKKTGDTLQRVNDHRRIQSFLTGSSLSTVFSLFNLIVFSIILAGYNLTIFIVFISASILFSGLIVVFLRKRKQLDYSLFNISSNEQAKMIQLVQGMTEIKLQSCETSKRWEWEQLQVQSFKLGMRTLTLNQLQQIGGLLINEGKNILITYLSAIAVIHGTLTLGQMLAIQYIIGQLNGPVEQLIGFVQEWQLAKISLDRLSEINAVEDEEPLSKGLLTNLPDHKTIKLNNISFAYQGAGNEPVLKNVSLTIPKGKTTAIVGNSGSGKTTLLKLLLKFYKVDNGKIEIDGIDIKDIAASAWRRQIGVVMQESFIFNDSILNNIAIDTLHIDYERIKNAINIANASFIFDLPLGINTYIGNEGTGISMGQKQRILIARAVYKNPEYLFFDEATNSLDSNNESIIVKNLLSFTKNKTVLVIAHRLSTVQKADQIIVLDKGIISERGTHEELILKRGKYYLLVKNQLDLT